MTKSEMKALKSPLNFDITIKICGMKDPHNIAAIAALDPDYLGFIFYEKSPRYFDGTIPKISSTIKKVGVFVDATIENIINKFQLHDLQAVQLHGNESANFIRKLRNSLGNAIEIIKVFSVGSDFDFQSVEDYEQTCDFFLFDTKGKSPGGNGEKFDWNILNNYKSSKPFFLSGGIGIHDLKEIGYLLEKNLPLYGIDLNSKLEIVPGLKDVAVAKEIIEYSRNYRK